MRDRAYPRPETVILCKVLHILLGSHSTGQKKYGYGSDTVLAVSQGCETSGICQILYSPRSVFKNPVEALWLSGAFPIKERRRSGRASETADKGTATVKTAVFRDGLNGMIGIGQQSLGG